MSTPIRVRKAKYSRYPRRSWTVRHEGIVLGRYATGVEALDFVRRLIRAAS